MQELARKFIRCLVRVTESEDLKDNIFKVVDAPIDFTVSDTGAPYLKIYKFVKDFHAERSEYPALSIVKTAFESRVDLEALEEIKEIEPLEFQTGEDFKWLVQELVKDLNRISLNNYLKEAQAINNGEYQSKNRKEIKAGSKDAVNHIVSLSERFFFGATSEQSQIEVAEASNDAWKRYEIAQKNPYANYGIMSGIAPIDNVVKGVKKKDLMLIAGAVGECKTTLALNYAYFASVHFGANVMFVTLEQSKENVADMYNALHASNSRLWGWQRGKDKNRKYPDGLDYDIIKEGRLTEKESKFYKLVLEDIAGRGAISRGMGSKVPYDYGRFDIWEPATELSPNLLRSKLEYEHKKNKINLLIVDYPGLMVADERKDSETASLNEIMKKMKIMARTFNNNEGIAVICPFQINREGKKSAVSKTEGGGGQPDPAQVLDKPIYSTFHLSYANEAERSADYILYTYLNQDLRNANQIHIGCIKNRHGGIFPPFIATTYLPSRKIFYVPDEDYTGAVPAGAVVEVSI